MTSFLTLLSYNINRKSMQKSYLAFFPKLRGIFYRRGSNSLKNLSPVNILFTPRLRDLGRLNLSAPGTPQSNSNLTSLQIMWRQERLLSIHKGIVPTHISILWCAHPSPQCLGGNKFEQGETARGNISISVVRWGFCARARVAAARAHDTIYFFSCAYGPSFIWNLSRT